MTDMYSSTAEALFSADVAGFPSDQSFKDFRREVSSASRFVRSAKAVDFLAHLAAQSRVRPIFIEEKQPLFRAQLAHSYEFVPDAGAILPHPAAPQRMLPLRDRATEGRVNPKGIPCLYLASDSHTAIAEVRPWIGSLVTVGNFEIVRLLKLVDCRQPRGGIPLRGIKRDFGSVRRDWDVWTDIGDAFSEPVTRDDDIASYAPTQVIAELFRSEGFDGLIYESAFGRGGLNVALFDLDSARMTRAELRRIDDVTLTHGASGVSYVIQVGHTENPL